MRAKICLRATIGWKSWNWGFEPKLAPNSSKFLLGLRNHIPKLPYKFEAKILIIDDYIDKKRFSSSDFLHTKKNMSITKHNFVYNGSSMCNGLIGIVFDKCVPNENNIMVPGSSELSDLSAPISIIKNRLKKHLLNTQEIMTPGRPKEWMPDNSWTHKFK